MRFWVDRWLRFENIPHEFLVLDIPDTYFDVIVFDYIALMKGIGMFNHFRVIYHLRQFLKFLL